MTTTTPTVPIGANGLEGWTSCCGACVTYSGDGILCCKACWEEVQPVEPSDPRVRRELGEVVMAVCHGEMEPEEGVARQRALLDDDTGRPIDHAPAAIIHIPGGDR
jgi:hypothetical protein